MIYRIRSSQLSRLFLVFLQLSFLLETLKRIYYLIRKLSPFYALRVDKALLGRA